MAAALYVPYISKTCEVNNLRNKQRADIQFSVELHRDIKKVPIKNVDAKSKFKMASTVHMLTGHAHLLRKLLCSFYSAQKLSFLKCSGWLKINRWWCTSHLFIQSVPTQKMLFFYFNDYFA